MSLFVNNSRHSLDDDDDYDNDEDDDDDNDNDDDVWISIIGLAMGPYSGWEQS